MDVHLGQTITTYLADGTTYRAKITAIFSRSAGFADVLVPTGASGGGHLGANNLEEVLVASTPEASPAALRSAISSLTAQYLGLQVSSRSVANAQYELLNSQTSYANNLLLALVGLLAAVALVNILVVATLQGREELLLLRRVGATARQLLAMTVLRAAGITLVGVVLGAAAQIAAVVAVSKALAGSSMPYIPVAPVGVILGLVVLLVGMATLGPTLRLLAEPRLDNRTIDLQRRVIFRQRNHLAAGRRSVVIPSSARHQVTRRIRRRMMSWRSPENVIVANRAAERFAQRCESIPLVREYRSAKETREEPLRRDLT